MKTIHLLITLLFFCSAAFAQNTSPETVYGHKPDKTGMMDANKVEAYMGRKASISITLKGKVLKVVNPKGGWFDIDAGNGRVISAHFRKNGINIPSDLVGKTVIAQGIATKQLVSDDLQHYAGDTVVGKKKHHVSADPKHRLVFSVEGLAVE